MKSRRQNVYCSALVKRSQAMSSFPAIRALRITPSSEARTSAVTSKINITPGRKHAPALLFIHSLYSIPTCHSKAVMKNSSQGLCVILNAAKNPLSLVSCHSERSEESVLLGYYGFFVGRASSE